MNNRKLKLKLQLWKLDCLLEKHRLPSHQLRATTTSPTHLKARRAPAPSSPNRGVSLLPLQKTDALPSLPLRLTVPGTATDSTASTGTGVDALLLNAFVKAKEIVKQSEFVSDAKSVRLGALEKTNSDVKVRIDMPISKKFSSCMMSKALSGPQLPFQNGFPMPDLSISA
jgi:hypothetical protein